MRFFVAIPVLMLAGCASIPRPTQDQLATADYGAAPTTYQLAIHRYFDSTLKDPQSIQYREISEPVKGYIAHGGGLAVKKYVTYGWQVEATVNAKNSYGGYVGFRTYTFLFRGEQIVDQLSPDE